MIQRYVHPSYRFEDYVKYRYAFYGGQEFIDQYLVRLPREEDADFQSRKEMSYSDSVAKSGITEISNAIILRTNEITRSSESPTYNSAVSGLMAGVDLRGSSMNRFITQQIVTELLVMGQVGVYVDNAQFNPASTLADLSKNTHPYLYAYSRESLMNWNFTFIDSEKVLKHILLYEPYEDVSLDKYGVVIVAKKNRYRQLTLTLEGVLVQVFHETVNTDDDTKILVENRRDMLQLKRIPFVLFDIGQSLMTDIADLQIALTNLSSVDISYIFNANFPFYVEPYDPKSSNQFLKTRINQETGEPEVSNVKTEEVVTGVTRGRKYPFGGNSPEFIHPSSEPLLASMDKQNRLEEKIRKLLHLSVTSVSASRGTTDSRRLDQLSFEGGLAAIGLELESGEKEIAKIWMAYENIAEGKVAIKYPSSYQIKSDSDRSEEAKQLAEISSKVPSNTFTKEVCKKITDSLLKGRISQEKFEQIIEEIEAAKYLTRDAKEIELDLKSGLVSQETASTARGYDGIIEIPIAERQHAERLARIMKAQMTGVGGVKDVNPTAPNTRLNDTQTKPIEGRGDGAV